MRLGVSVMLIGLAFAAIQIFVLPPDGFMTGDQGSKYLQTRAFALHGPLDPAIDVMSRDIDPLYEHTEPKLKNRRGRLVSEFMWLLPMLGAPFVALFGLRGLYVVPALSAVVVFLGAAKLGRRTADPDGTITGWIVLLTTPIFFYGLELWEHASAAACVMIAAVLLAPGKDPGAARSSPGRAFAAGAAVACGFLFREEAVVALPALLIGRAIARDRDRLKDLIVAGLWSGAGALTVFVASMPVNLMMYGAALPMHMTQDAWEYAKNISYLQVRRDIVMELFMPAQHAVWYAIALAGGVAASIHASRRSDGSPTTLWVVHVAVFLMVLIGVALPLWQLAWSAQGHATYRIASAAHTWVFLLALLYWPWLGPRGGRLPARFLIVSGLLLIVFTSFVVPSIGGAQWSPRFFLQAAPLLAIPAAATAWTRSSRRALVWAARGILAASFLMQVTGIVFLHRAKTRFADVTHTLARLTQPDEVILSDVYWVPEVTATLAPERRMLFSWNSSDIPVLAAMAVRHGIERFDLVTVMALTGHPPPEAIDVPGAPCRYVRSRTYRLDTSGLTLSQYSCPP